MAQDPESLQGPPEDDAVDTSHGLDLATIYSSQGVDSEVEADIIRGIMESNGIPAIVVRAMGYPALGFEVRVPIARFEEVPGTHMTSVAKRELGAAIVDFLEA